MNVNITYSNATAFGDFSRNDFGINDVAIASIGALVKFEVILGSRFSLKSFMDAIYFVCSMLLRVSLTKTA